MASTKASPPVGPEGPMPPVPTKEIYQVALIGELELQQTCSIFYYQDKGSVGSGTNAAQKALFVMLRQTAGFVDAYRACCSSTWSARYLRTWCPTYPYLSTYEEALDPLRGSGPATSCPNQTAVVIHKMTDLRGKHGRGRVSIPAVPTAWVIGTGLNDDTSHQALALAMMGTLNDVAYTFTPGVLATSRDKLTLGWAPLQAAVVSTLLGTIRRRRPGYGV